jgi:flagellar biosynthesis anti-sigma factor FlgM
MRVNSPNNKEVIGTSHGTSEVRKKKILRIGGSANPEVKKPNNDAKVAISSRAQEFSKAKAVATNAPDRNVDARIAQLRAQIANGTYEPDFDKVADKMIKDHADFGA